MVKIRIIDAHAHLFDIPGYLEKLITTMDEVGIERICISGLGALFNCVDNKGVLNSIEKYPDKIIGAYFIRPGISRAEEIIKANDQGFKMLKVTLPKKPYDHKEYLPLWKTANEYQMPILFHTGVITLFNNFPDEDVSSWRMHPMRIETIANAFPDLNMIIAHLGVHWNNDAAELIRMKKNVYADLSGALNGWRTRMDRIGLDNWLWWPGAFKKLVFGTDVLFHEIAILLNEDKKRLEDLHIDKKTQELIFYKNILRMVGEK